MYSDESNPAQAAYEAAMMLERVEKGESAYVLEDLKRKSGSSCSQESRCVFYVPDAYGEDTA